MIKKIALSLGATMAYDEVSHVHCEWKNGVDTTGKAASDSVARTERGAEMGKANKITHVRHCLLRTA